jgi:hypothetical protein
MTQIKISFPCPLSSEINRQLDIDIAENNKIEIGIWQEIEGIMTSICESSVGKYVIHKGYKVTRSKDGKCRVQSVRGDYEFYRDTTLEEDMIFSVYGFLRGVILLGVLYFDEKVSDVDYLLSDTNSKLSTRKTEKLKAERSWLIEKLQEYKNKI